ncbi:MAG: ribonuclease E/G [Sphingomonadales bacterium]|jgi:hypothetical protein
MIALIEDAPGASRALVLDHGAVVEAHVARADDPLAPGLVAPGRLASRSGGRGVVALAGHEALIDPVPADWPEGQTRLVEVIRPARTDGSRDKQARVAAHPGPARPAPSLNERLAAHSLQPVPAFGADLLAEAGWDAVVDEAITGRIDFRGGRLLAAPTPAMLVIDVDGDGDLLRLAENAAHAVAAMVRRHGIGGPLVVDFPSLQGKAQRAAVDAILAAELPPPFEKTAINGFGLVQIIRPRGALSLFEQVRLPGFAALELLRRAARLLGPVTITASPRSIDWLVGRPGLLAETGRRTGGRVALVAAEGVGQGHVQQG